MTAALSFAVAQPLYEILKSNPAFFVTHQADGLDLLAFCLALSLGLPLASSLALVVAQRIHPAFERRLFWIQMGLGGALLALLVARRLDGGMAATTVAAGIAFGLGWWLSRSAAFQRAMAILAVSAIVFPVLFLLAPEIRALWSGAETPPDNRSKRQAAAPALDRPVVLVVFDELPVVSLMTAEQSIDASRYPNFARLAATGHWYRQATTVAQSTVYAVPAMLSGRYPGLRQSLAPAVKDYPKNLFTLIDAKMNVWETSTRLCPRRRCKPPAKWLIPRRERLPAILRDTSAVYTLAIAPLPWGAELADVDDRWSGFWNQGDGGSSKPPRGAAERIARPEETFSWFLNALAADGGGSGLHYIHSMIPHAPWAWLPNGRNYAQFSTHPHGLRNQGWRGTEWETAQAHQRHLLNVGFADYLLGRLLDTLEDLGWFDEALIIVVSDHGSTFATGQPRRNLRRQPLDPLVSVPLFVKFPGQREGSVDDRNAELIDVLPTILETVGQAVPEGLDGTSLAGPARPDHSLKRTFRSGNMKGGGSAGISIDYTLDQRVGRQEALDRLISRFGTDGWRSLFAAGPRPELIGTRPSTRVQPASSRRLEAEVVDSAHFDAVDLEAPTLPVHIYGSLSPFVPGESLELAVALNGKIVATTETFVHQGERLDFTALFSPTTLRSGANSLELFAIGATAESTTLTPIPIASSPMSPSSPE